MVEIGPLADLLRGRGVAVLTGAGCSTDSGIPDYRGGGTRRRATNPIQYRSFVDSEATRQRYWARSVLGWPKIRDARPNAGHRAIARLEQAGVFRSLITQNVDGLHQAAGSPSPVELHGNLGSVRCLDCGALSSRDELQARLLDLNPGWTDQAAELAPDGDAHLEAVDRFRVARCCSCGGRLKPHVVFFGEAVPVDRVERAYAAVEATDVLLVIGSSLAVFSGYRFVRAAAKRGQPVAIVNLGDTRGDSEAALKLESPIGTLLPALASALA